MQTALEYVEGQMKEYGYKNITGVLREHHQVWSLCDDHHRWYSRGEAVTEIDGEFIMHEWFHNTGDNSWYDMELEVEPESISWAEKKEVVVTKWTPISQKEYEAKHELS